MRSILCVPAPMETSSIDENSKSYYTTPRLTTTFTPPASCLQPTFLLSPDGSDSASFETVKFNYANIYRGVYEQCYPPDYYLRTPFITTDGETDGVMRHYFSPGICPSGWLGAGTNVQESTSTIVCCPRYVTRNKLVPLPGQNMY